MATAMIKYKYPDLLNCFKKTPHFFFIIITHLIQALKNNDIFLTVLVIKYSLLLYNYLNTKGVLL